MKANLPYAVVIPAYNERVSLRSVVHDVLRFVTDVTVVDDASSDGTADTVRDLPVRVLRNDINQGKGASVWRGARDAASRGARWVVTLDADGQHDPADLVRLIAASQEYPDALIIGARTRHRETVPKRRAAANRLADFCVGWASAQPVIDSQSGLRVYPALLFATLKKPPKREGFAFESQAVIVAARQGIPILGLAIEARYPKDSRPSRYRPLVDTFHIMVMLFRQVLGLGMYPQGLYRSLIGEAVLLDAPQPAHEPATARKGGG